MSWVEKVLAHLSERGHRVTAPRRAILERITQYSQPFSAEQLFKDVGGDGGPIGGHVVIAGYGRVGETISQLLDAQQVRCRVCRVEISERKNTARRGQIRRHCRRAPRPTAPIYNPGTSWR